MADKEKKKCQDCYYFQGSCLCGDSKNYGKFLFLKACECWCTHPDVNKKEKEAQEGES